MLFRFILTFSFICLLGITTIAQTTISGFVTEQGNSSRLAYVNLGVKGKSIGTVTDVEGRFSLQIPQGMEMETLTFTLVGYYENTISIRELEGRAVPEISLKRKITQLPAVTISDHKLVEKSFGIYKSHALLHFTDGSTNQSDIFEIAQIINLDSTPARINSLNLHVNDSRRDSGMFRINFYSLNDGRPGERLVEQSIIQTKAIREGWLTFDLREHNLYLKGKFVAAIEFLPNKKTKQPVYYEVKLGGSAKSFVRTNSQGEWSVPPHHYRMYLTAMVPDKKSKKEKENSEERESSPSFRMYSEMVKDSFSIFVATPVNYKPEEKYPVIYLLDANAYFDLVADLVKELKKEVIVVGIGYENAFLMDSLRDRDFTYPKALPSDSFRVSGGGKQFLTFITQELIPMMEERYATDTAERTLMGHSLGGYFSIYAMEQAMENGNGVFKNYVAASPSLDYCDKYLERQLSHKLHSETKRHLYISFGGREDSEEGGTGSKGADDFNSFTRIIDDSRHLNIEVSKQLFPNYGHMETAIPGFEKAIRLFY